MTVNLTVSRIHPKKPPSTYTGTVHGQTESRSYSTELTGIGCSQMTRVQMTANFVREFSEEFRCDPFFLTSMAFVAPCSDSHHSELTCYKKAERNLKCPPSTRRASLSHSSGVEDVPADIPGKKRKILYIMTTNFGRNPGGRFEVTMTNCKNVSFSAQYRPTFDALWRF